MGLRRRCGVRWHLLTVSSMTPELDRHGLCLGVGAVRTAAGAGERAQGRQQAGHDQRQGQRLLLRS